MKKRVFAFIAAVMLFSFSFTFFTFASSENPRTRQVPRLVDKAKLLDAESKEELLSKLDVLSEELQFDFVVATVKTTGGKDIEEFSDDYFDYNGFGYGENNDGVALIISMNPRAVYISACGEGTDYFDYEDAQNIIDVFYDDLKAGEYAKVVETFIDQAQDAVINGRVFQDDDGEIQENESDFQDTESDFQNNNEPLPLQLRFSLFFSNWTVTILIPVAVALILAFITMAIATRGLKSVRKKEDASDYEVLGSLSLTRSEDRFLFSNVSKTPKPKPSDDNPSSFGSSGSHIGSSGNSHSGGGRSF